MAVLLREPAADLCKDVLSGEPRLLISAGTLAEVLIVAGMRGLGAEMQRLIDAISCEVVPVTEAAARRVAMAYAKWGKGAHPAGLNFGDCFAYDVAKSHDCPLLYVGNDFAMTDVNPAISPQA